MTEPTKSEQNVVKTVSKAGSGSYGFSYASLSDLAKQGVKIPKMRVTVIDGRQFVEYFDGKDWQIGAQVITDFESRGMNKAQAYGSALTYARRYTVQLAECVAVDDDKNVENAKPEPSSSKPVASSSKPASEKQVELLKQLLGDKADEVIAKNQPLTSAKASKLITAVKAKKAEQNTSELAEMGEPVSLEDIPF